jgi:hypothetical protein
MMFSQLQSSKAERVALINKPAMHDHATIGMTTTLLLHNYHLSNTQVVMYRSMVSSLVNRYVWADVHYSIFLMLGLPIPGFSQIMDEDIKLIDPPDEESSSDITNMAIQRRSDVSFASDGFQKSQIHPAYHFLYKYNNVEDKNDHHSGLNAAVSPKRKRTNEKTAAMSTKSKRHASVSSGRPQIALEQPPPSMPDYNGHSAFIAAYEHHNFLEDLRQWPKWMAGQYFESMSDEELDEFDEERSKTERYWAEHAELFTYYFPNSESTSEASSSCPFGCQQAHYSRDDERFEAIEISTDSDDHEISIHAPRPHYGQHIAADFEDMLEHSQEHSPESFTDYMSGHGASGAMLGQQDNYLEYQHQWQEYGNVPWGLQPQSTQPFFAFTYPSEQQEWLLEQQMDPYDLHQPPSPPGWEQYPGIQPIYTPEYHAWYQEMFM